jgi:hypothetical protein
MRRLSEATWFSNAYAVCSGIWGKITERATENQCSRQTAYRQATIVREALERRRDPHYEDLLAEKDGLAQENCELWEAFADSVQFPEGRQIEFAARGTAMGLSLSQIQELLAVVLGAAQAPSRSQVGRWIQEAARKAGQVLKALDQFTRKLAVCVCLDEIFFRRDPVLVVVEPHSMAWLAGERTPDRSGATWHRILRPFQNVEMAVSDAGTGLQKGLRDWDAERQEAGTPAVQTSLDIFHTDKEAQPVLAANWKKAEVLWEKAEACDRRLAQCQRQGQDARGASCAAGHAWRRAQDAFHAAETEDAVWDRAKIAFSLFLPDGTLNTEASAREELQAVCNLLPGDRWAKVCRMLEDPRALTFLKRMSEQLELAEPNAALRAELLRLKWLRAKFWDPEVDAARLTSLVAVQETICHKLRPDWKASYEGVAQVLQTTVRASSAVECMNSVIRMHQARHRNLTQPLLDLKRLYWNTRRFREGKRKAASPYKLLGLKLPDLDFWRLLNADPATLTQQLST